MAMDRGNGQVRLNSLGHAKLCKKFGYFSFVIAPDSIKNLFNWRAQTYFTRLIPSVRIFMVSYHNDNFNNVNLTSLLSWICKITINLINDFQAFLGAVVVHSCFLNKMWSMSHILIALKSTATVEFHSSNIVWKPFLCGLSVIMQWFSLHTAVYLTAGLTQLGSVKLRCSFFCGIFLLLLCVCC